MQNAEKREACYAARDNFFQCLRTNGAESQECEDISSVYEKACPPSWRKYFRDHQAREDFLQGQVDEARRALGRKET